MTYEDRYNNLRDSWENDELCFSEINFSDEKKKESKKKDSEKSLEEKVNEIHKEMKKQKKKRRLKKILKGVGLGLVTDVSVPLALKAKEMGSIDRVLKTPGQWEKMKEARKELVDTMEKTINPLDRLDSALKYRHAKNDNILKSIKNELKIHKRLTDGDDWNDISLHDKMLSDRDKERLKDIIEEDKEKMKKHFLPSKKAEAVLTYSQAKDPADDSPLEANPNTSDGKQVQATSNIKHKIDSRVRAIKDMQKESGLSKGEFIKKLMRDKQLQADYKDRVRSNN